MKLLIFIRVYQWRNK